MKNKIIALVMLSTIVIIVSGCMQWNLDTVTQVETEDEYTFGEEFVSDVLCVNDEKIKLTVTNIEDSAWNIEDDIMFYLESAVDETPECNKDVLEPGESATCTLDSTTLGFNPSIIVQTPEHNDVRKVSC